MEEKIEVLNTVNEYLNNLKNGIGQLVSAFEVGENNKGCSLIPLVADGIAWIMEAINLTRDIHKNYIDISMIDDKLNEIVEAIENEDYILVGDLFNYEILPILDNIHMEIRKVIAN